MWWNINQVLSYNALINFIVGPRGPGKTYGSIKKGVEQFLKDGSQFIYIRRYREEYKEAARKLFDAHIANNEFEGHTFEVKGKNFLIDGEVCGYGMVLSTSSKKKSLSFPKVKLIIFDEFILDPKKRATDRYLPEEVDTFLNLIETIIRMRDDVRIFLLANALSWVNPYFVYFKIDKPRNKKKIKVKNDVLIQLVDLKEFKEAKNKTRFAKVTKGTQFHDHTINNEFIRDDYNFIRKPFDKMRYFFTLKSKGQFYGVYVANEDGSIYVCEVYQKNYPLKYVAILDNHEPNMLLASGTKSPPYKKFIDMFKNGCVYYDNLNTKSEVYEIMKGK